MAIKKKKVYGDTPDITSYGSVFRNKKNQLSRKPLSARFSQFLRGTLIYFYTSFSSFFLSFFLIDFGYLLI